MKELSIDKDRRKELATFLKIKRSKVPPPKKGHFPFSRRRTPGLRREEVAEMAGISSSWYTWLEQGRNIHPSSELLLRVGKVLGLNSIELKHLFDLAAKDLPAPFEAPQQEVPETLKNLVCKIIQTPAFVMSEKFDFLLWNQKFNEQVYDLNRIPPERRTWLDLVFIVKSSRKAHLDWQEDAQRIVAEFRWSVGKDIGKPWVQNLVSRMSQESPEFAKLWSLHDVQERKKSRILKILSDQDKQLFFTRSIYIPVEAENLKLVILTPKE